jgi:hypothetical protein
MTIEQVNSPASQLEHFLADDQLSKKTNPSVN